MRVGWVVRQGVVRGVEGERERERERDHDDAWRTSSEECPRAISVGKVYVREKNDRDDQKLRVSDVRKIDASS
jgi:hypothetical protein